MSLHPINETFSEEEWSILKPIKLKSGLNWHDFLLESVNEWNNSILDKSSKQGDITDKVRKALADSNQFSHVQYIGNDVIEVKSDATFYNIKVRGSLANLFGSD